MKFQNLTVFHNKIAINFLKRVKDLKQVIELSKKQTKKMSLNNYLVLVLGLIFFVGHSECGKFSSEILISNLNFFSKSLCVKTKQKNKINRDSHQVTN